MRHRGTTHPLEHPVPRQIIAWLTCRVSCCLHDTWCLNVAHSIIIYYERDVFYTIVLQIKPFCKHMNILTFYRISVYLIVTCTLEIYLCTFQNFLFPAVSKHSCIHCVFSRQSNPHSNRGIILTDTLSFEPPHVIMRFFFFYNSLNSTLCVNIFLF